MNNLNILSNKMLAFPAFHAQIELAQVNGLWFYGYRIHLIDSWVNSPMPLPTNNLPSDQRGAVTRDFAVVLALFEISKKSPVSDSDNPDERAVGQALVDECRNLINETAAKMLIADNAILRKNGYARAKLGHILTPKMMEKLGKEDESFSISIPKANAAQPTLF